MPGNQEFLHVFDVETAKIEQGQIKELLAEVDAIIKNSFLSAQAYKNAIGGADLRKAGDDLTKQRADEVVAAKKLEQTHLAAARARKAEAEAELSQMKLKEAQARANAVTEKQANAAAVAAGRERILQLKAQQAEEQKLIELEKQRNLQEQEYVKGFRNQSTGNRSVAAPAGPISTAVAGNALEVTAATLVKTQTNLRGVQNEQKALTTAFKAGEITLSDYNIKMGQAIILETDYKKQVSSLTAEIKNSVREQVADKGSLEQRRAALIRLNSEYDNLGPLERSSAYGQRLQSITSGLTTQVKSLEEETGRAQRNVGNYGSAFDKVGTQLNKFTSLSTIAATTLSRLFRTFIGFFIISEILSLFKDLGSAIKDIYEKAVAPVGSLNDAIKKNGEAIKEAKGKYVEASVAITELKGNIEAAKNGFANKDEVVKQYNDTLGKTMGQVKDLGELEKKIASEGDAYIKYTLLKAAASVAAGKAAEQEYNAEVERRKKDTEFSKAVVDTRISGSFNAREFDLDKKRVADAQAARKAQAVKSAQDEADAQRKIMKKFTDDANDIAKGFNWDIMGGQGGKGKKGRPDTAEQKQFDDTELQRKKKYFEDLAAIEFQYYGARAAEEKRAFETEVAIIIGQRQVESDNEQRKLATGQINAQAYDNAIARIHKKADDELLKAEEKKNAELLKIQIQSNALRIAQERADMALFQQVQDEIYAQKQSDLKRGAEAYKNIEEENKYILLAELDDRFKKGLIKEEAYQKRRKAIIEDATRNELKGTIANLQAEKSLVESRNKNLPAGKKEDTTGIDANIAKAKADLAGLGVDAQSKKEKDLEAEKKKRDQLEIEAARAVFDTVQSFADAAYEKQIIQLEKQIQMNDKLRDTEINRINRSTLSETQKAAQIQILNATTETQNNAIASRQREIKRKQAAADKAFSIAKIIEETAVAVIGAIAETPGPIGIAEGIAIGVIGGASLAKVIATPIPAFAGGTDSAPGGFALTDEKGPEGYITPSGKAFMGGDQPAIRYLERGTRVIPHDEMNKAMYASMVRSTAGMIERNDTANEIRELRQTVNRQTQELAAAFARQKKNTVVNVRVDSSWGDYTRKNVFD